jgi:hypothetical protein
MGDCAAPGRSGTGVANYDAGLPAIGYLPPLTMNQPSLSERFEALPALEKAILATLALTGDTPGITRLLNYLREAKIKSGSGVSHTFKTLEPVLSALKKQGWVIQKPSGELKCPSPTQVLALQAAQAGDVLQRIGDAVHVVDKIEVSNGMVYPHSYSIALRVLRMAMLLGWSMAAIRPRLLLCAGFAHYLGLHPYLEICARPFDPKLFALLHPRVQEDAMAYLLPDCLEGLIDVRPFQQIAEKLLAPDINHDPDFIAAYAEHCLLCSQFEQALALQGSHQPVLKSIVLLLTGDLPGAIAGFEEALVHLRGSSGKRKAVLTGLGGNMHILALLRSGDAKLKTKAQSYLELAMRIPHPRESGLSCLNYLNVVQTGVQPITDQSRGLATKDPLTRLFAHLVDHWLGAPASELKTLLLRELFLKSEAAGFEFIAVQAAELLSRTSEQLPSGDDAALLARATALRQKLGLVVMADWFERQEPWQRQLAALAKLSTASSSADAGPQARLVWELHLTKTDAVLSPREQKRKGREGWTGGRAVALKRLREEVGTMDFLTAQDRKVCDLIKHEPYNYYGGAEYSLDNQAALVHLIGHPLVFWQNPPGVRVEILPGVPELEIKKTASNTLTLRLQPPLDKPEQQVLISQETPTRLRVTKVTPEHRQIAAILGKSLKVPARAKDQVLDAIRAISSLITVQSDIDMLPTNAEQVEADSRLHVHLMPHGDGLRITLLVRPFASAGPYYAPGAGSESVIAEINGKPLQARRSLKQEKIAATALVANCPALRDASEAHGERVIDEPETCLELLLQLQAQGEAVLLAWPEGQKFKVSRELGGKGFSLSIKRNLDWFAVSGELQVDDGEVIDLLKLLALTAGGHGRFIHLGDNQFLALTDEFRRRLNELRAFSDPQGDGVRVHRLAAGVLQDLADEAGKVKSDKHWKEHLARLGELDALTPVLPATLQADLRDYQLSGFNWLCRLAHWGVGACLADDMGLGKTLQALALLLDRAPQGPALVVAPTSVCMNWIGEIARFAPTLNVILFGSGDRQQTLTDLKPFDLVVASYGLLQQETELFTAVQWHSIVLDEAQAIKNHATKRSQAAMALQGDFRMICSGTPLENHLGELWNLFRFINPGLLGSLEHFNERYAGPIERQQDAGARNRLRKLIAPFMLRRTKSQVLSELPSRTEILRQVELSKEEAALYEALRREALERLADTGAQAGQRNIQILAEIMKLRRACCNPQLVAPALGLPSSKLAAFGELLDELLENRHKALVFSQFVDHLSLIRNELDARGVRYQYLDGSTPMQERAVRVKAFQAGDGDVFLISLKAGGTGLNLTAADYVIHMDPWWNPAVEDQASDRAHRIGQTRPVTIYRLVAQGTIEEKIVDLHKTKRALADSLLEGSDLAAKMTADDMLALLQEEWRAEAGQDTA